MGAFRPGPYFHAEASGSLKQFGYHLKEAAALHGHGFVGSSFLGRISHVDNRKARG
jgi:hypothetical protein